MKNLIEGKRVIFVGACPNIKGMKYGATIDGYDVVVKTNGSILLSGDEYYRDYGKRCDVLYTNNQFQREMRPLPVKDWNLKYLCMKVVSEKDMRRYLDRVPVRVIRDAMVQVNRELHGATMGAYIFTDLLNFNPKELFITGVDWFASKKKAFEHDNYSEYLDCYLPDKIRKQGNKINKGKTEDGHGFVENAEYILKMFNENRNMITHSFLYELLEGITAGRIDQI